MELNFDDIWVKVLEILKNEFNPVSFTTWFQPTKIHDITNDKVVLLVPMPLHKRVFESEYKELLINTFASVLDEEKNIECVLVDDIKAEKLVNAVVNNNEVINNTPKTYDSNLNKSLTFDNFVVGDTNKFAKTAALGVAEDPENPSQHNPFFIYGKSGLGKTHLLHAIGNYITEHNSNLRVLYARSDTFREDYTSIASSGNSMDYANEFKEKYRTVDVLIIDDIQSIAGSEKTLEEFFHIFNYLHSNNKQIIISSDRSPDDLKELEERLRSRFAMGLPVDIWPPDFELRCRIVKEKISKLAYADKVTDEAIEYIAQNCDTNVRIIEGGIARLSAYTSMIVPDVIDVEFANEALKDYIKTNPYVNNDIASIQRAVADYYKLTVEVLKGKKRSANIAYPRMVAMYMCRTLTDQSFPRIGLEFGGKDHSTVIHAVDKITEDLKTNSQLKEIINEIKSKL